MNHPPGIQPAGGTEVRRRCNGGEAAASRGKNMFSGSQERDFFYPRAFNSSLNAFLNIFPTFDFGSSCLK
jgi:hypothetical protein